MGKIRWYKKYIKNYWKPFFIALIFLTFEALCDLMQPTIMSRIVDKGVANKDIDYVIKNGGLMLLVTALGAVSAVSRNIISSNVSQKFGAELRGDLFKKIQNFSFENIDRFETASLITRLTYDVTQVQNFIHGMMRIFVKAPILCVGGIIMASLLDAKLSLILAVVVPVIAILIFINMKLGYPVFIKVQRAVDKVNGVMREYLGGVRVVKAFNRFDYEKERFDMVNNELAEISTSAMRVMAAFSPGVTLTVNIGIIAVLWLGGLRVNRGEVHVGKIIAFTNYMTQILFSLMMISFVFNMFIRSKASLERIGEVFSEKSRMPVLKNPEEMSDIKGRVDFENVCFSYSGASGEPVLKNITFKAMPGETIGIIGSTGSGKSSLINLIPRFYDADSGFVNVDGVDVRDADIINLRDKIAVVTQKTILFTGTIEDNIRWGKEDASVEEVRNAALTSQADHFIKSFPEGYNTMLGQGGVNLSGGQKQRISIARALIKNPEILILDDCTSAVDVTTESKIREGLRKYSKDLTCFIIAQRITSVMGSDRIIVLDNGEITGIGKHDELMKTCDVYKDIFRSQIGKGVL